MPIVPTHLLTPEALEGLPIQQIYNALDCCVTYEVHNELQKLASPPVAYDFARAMQAPAMEMMLRGILVDRLACDSAKAVLRTKLARLEHILNTYAMADWGKPLNPRSHQQLHTYFYEHMRLPQITTYKKGVAKESMDREALERLQAYFHAEPIINVVLAFRDYAKQLSVLETEIDYDGRIRTSYNIVGTETGRWSSSTSALGTGTNLQNITYDLRNIFVSDPGWKFCAIDLEQAESREVGLRCGMLFDDWTYLDACESGDLHTTVCRIAWDDVKWTGDLRQDKALAEANFYRHLSRRDLGKRLGHGSNYYGQPRTMAKHTKLPIPTVERFQANYFAAFPGIPRWHQWVAEQLQTTQMLTTPFGRTRHFFGRPRDETTLREAIAHDPQSSTGDRLNLGLWRVWRTLGTRVRITAQLHDALYFQFHESDNEADVISAALACISTPMRTQSGRVFDVPGEAKTGWNLGSASPGNPDGLRKFKGSDTRKRTAQAHNLDRALSQVL